MSGLFVICATRPQRHLSQRRNGYLEYSTGAGWAYVREEANSAHLGRRAAGQVTLSAPFLADAASVADDPGASVFFIDMRNAETIEAAVARGLRLPLGSPGAQTLQVDGERRPASGA